MDFVKVTAPLTISFTDVTKEYGRAEFGICFKYWRAWITNIYISTAQQNPAKAFDVAMRYRKKSMTFRSYDGLDDVKMWLTGLCKEHKLPFLRLYVPTGSGSLAIDENGLTFRRAHG